MGGNQLKELRRRRLLTQEELAQAVGTTYQTIQRWERGESEPRPAAKRRLCAVLGVTPDELLAALREPAPGGQTPA